MPSAPWMRPLGERSLIEARPAAFAALEASRFDQPDATLHRFLDPHGAQAVGFKLKFDELVRPQWSGIRQRVEADAGLRIVFLHRRDLLRRYLSHQIVLRQTGVTNVPAGGDVPGVAAFEVDIEDCLRDMAETRARTLEFAVVFAAIRLCSGRRISCLRCVPQSSRTIRCRSG